ncbi:MAG: DUF5320 domain-containing protein [Dehalococcoidia bacterium]|nr:DUF5320 domain-containing protein [Dehalococcoidia bacterium]
MPGFDGTGPAGKGPMTGCGMGYCAIPLNTPRQEKNFLLYRSKILINQIEQLEKRIKELEQSEVKIKV